MIKYLSNAVKGKFQTPERTGPLLCEWDVLSLNNFLSTNSDKSASKCFDFLITKLPDINTSLPDKYLRDTVLKNKFLNSVRDVESFRLSHHKPADTLQLVISDFHASLKTVNRDALTTAATSWIPTYTKNAH